MQCHSCTHFECSSTEYGMTSPDVCNRMLPITNCMEDEAAEQIVIVLEAMAFKLAALNNCPFYKNKNEALMRRSILDLKPLVKRPATKTAVFGAGRAATLAQILAENGSSFRMDPYPDDEYVFDYPDDADAVVAERLPKAPTYARRRLVSDMDMDDVFVSSGTVVTPLHYASSAYLVEFDAWRFWVSETESEALI